MLQVTLCRIVGISFHQDDKLRPGAFKRRSVFQTVVITPVVCANVSESDHCRVPSLDWTGEERFARSDHSVNPKLRGHIDLWRQTVAPQRSYFVGECGLPGKHSLWFSSTATMASRLYFI